ncbi:MAG: hypothetical protein M1821_003589 [Bathelium mastoideum]|nr:MAG: hypothetical protein M1821_003589 [Bathelium mastoideum]KAI9684877.1 MAG: hypothetical protein M1822_005526 [Bathelium mastoideum]
MSGADPDKNWSPSGRPQSTIAQSFSAQLDDIFDMSGNLDSLSENVEQKKRTVDTHNQELEALEARLRETEERLKVVTTSQPGSRSPSQRRDAERTQNQTPLATNAASKAADFNRSHRGYAEQDTMAGASQQPRPSSAYNQRTNSSSKANAYSMPPMPGGMPDTPTSHSSAKDYVMVNRSGGS